MKKRLGLLVFALVCVFGTMMIPNKTEAKAYAYGAYVSGEYLRPDPDHRPDRGGYGYYIVTLDSGYLNVRNAPSTNGKIIGKLYNGDKVVTKVSNWEYGWEYVVSPSFN
ncbi:SH3 domain-containing protein [Clostridium hydrogeniformans]|uniref:SH3 domain-containing protein n=1 Tax=Clostridium hydrogeniformans TaxID=349933 RepID=UPI00048A431A|nr:SH3 domain-containing protein [Clostridium hydrogeniformans]